MPTSLGFANSAGFRGRKFEPMTSSNANRRAMVTPRGILRGFRPVPDAAVQTLKLEVDPLLGDSLMNVTPVDLADTSDGFALTYRETTSITLDLSDEAGTTIFVGLTSKYNILSFGSAIPPNWYAYTQAEIDDGTANEAVIICSVDVPASAIPLVAVDIDESERDESWMWVSARGGKDIPLVTPSYDDLFLYWSFQNLAASSTLATTTAEKKRGNSSILLDVDDVGAVTNEFGPGEVVSVVPGELLFVKFWYRTSASVNFSTNPLFKVEFLTSDGSPLGTTDISIPTAPQTNFTLIQDQILVPATGHRAIFSFDVQTNGVTDFYVDCLQVYARRLDSDASGWLDDNDKFLARNMGVHTLYFRNEHTHATQGPWTFGVGSGSGGLQFRRKIGVNSAIWLGDEEDSSVQMGINTTSPDTMLHLRGDPEDTTVIRMELDKTAIVANDVYGRIEWEGQDSDTDASGVRGSIAGIAEDTSGKMAIVFHTAASAESPPVAEIGRFSSTGLGLGDFSDSTDIVDTLLHLRNTVGNAIIRLERDDTDINKPDIYGILEWEGQDSGGAGIRGSIRGQAEDASGAMALVFATAADTVADPPVDRVKINNLGWLIVGDNFTQGVASSLFDTADETAYGFDTDTGNSEVRAVFQSETTGTNVVALYNSDFTGDNNNWNAIRFYREAEGKTQGTNSLNKQGALVFRHDGIASADYKGLFQLFVNDGSDDLTIALPVMQTDSSQHTTFGAASTDSNSNGSTLRIASNQGVASAHTALTLTFDNLNTTAAGGTYPIGSIDFHGNFNSGTDAGVDARIYASATVLGAGSLYFSTGTSGNPTTRLSIDPSGRVLVGSGTPNSYAALEVSSTVGALILPRMTTGERDAMTGTNGMLVYNTSVNKIQGFQITTWFDLV